MYLATVSEDSKVGSTIVSVTASDANSGSNGIVSTYEIIGGSGTGTFNINAESGTIVTIKSLDREMVSNYDLTVQASDQGNPPLTATASVLITASDVNDNTPVFSQTSYTATLPLDSPLGTVVATTTAKDGDIGTNGEISYAIADGNQDNIFSINSKTGVISVAQVLSTVSNNFTLIVEATDKAQQPLSSTTTVEVFTVQSDSQLTSSFSSTTSSPSHSHPLQYYSSLSLLPVIMLLNFILN